MVATTSIVRNEYFERYVGARAFIDYSMHGNNIVLLVKHVMLLDVLYSETVSRNHHCGPLLLVKYDLLRGFYLVGCSSLVFRIFLIHW